MTDFHDYSDRGSHCTCLDYITQDLEIEVKRLHELLQRSRSVIDELMGDSDIDDDESKEFLLMQDIAGVLSV